MMNNDGGRPIQSGRMQWGSYGFLAGILTGIVLGWMFNGFVGAFVRVGMVLLVVLPLVLAYVGWRRFIAPLLRSPSPEPYGGVNTPLGAIETRGVVHEPHAR
jgi:hypothetical protein